MAAIVTLTNSDNGSQWRTRANTSESLAQQLQAKLRTSEAASKSLQSRTVALAAEKAKAEDNSTVRNVSKSVASSISGKLTACTDGLEQVFNELSNASSSAEVQRIAATDLQSTFRACDSAATAAEGFTQYLNDDSGS